MFKSACVIAVSAQIIVLALLALGAMAQPADDESASGQETGTGFAAWLFRAGDDPAWKRYRLDESQWKAIKVPGSWQAQGFETPSGLGWYRAHVHIANATQEAELGVALGHIYNADQVFFNGVPIGSEGYIGREVVEAHTKTRVYRIPRDAIRYGQDNVLAVRIKNTQRASGIVTGPIAIGDYSMLSMEAEGNDSSIKVFQGMVIGLFLVLMVFSNFLYLHGLRNRTNLYFALFLIVITAATLLDSLYFYDLGLKTPQIQRVIYSLDSLVPMVLLLFVVTIVGGRLRAWEKVAMGFMGVIAVLFLLPPKALELVLPMPLADQMSLIRLAWLGGLALGSFMIVRGLHATYRGVNGGMLIAIGAALPLVGSLLSQQPRLLPAEIDPILVGIVLMVLLFLFAVAGRYFALTQRLQALTQHMTNVQEMERQRLSRDLHDSLGQNLVSFQLNLKMAATKLEHPLITGMLKDVAASIRRLDDTLQGLRPTELEHRGLCDLIERHCRRVAEQTGIDIQVQVMRLEHLPDKLKENLFHIFQEALNNCVKHGGAKQVVVRLAQPGGRLTLTVSDDGAGFEVRTSPGRGLGMLTMRERANLIGARLTINSKPGKGATVAVEAPLHD